MLLPTLSLSAASEAAAAVKRSNAAADPSKPKGRRPGSAFAGPTHAAVDIDALPSHHRARKGAAKAKAKAAAAEGDALDAEYRRAEAMRYSNMALLAEMRVWEGQDKEADDAAAAGLVSPLAYNAMSLWQVGQRSGV
jgi:hypothetical protein